MPNPLIKHKSVLYDSEKRAVDEVPLPKETVDRFECFTRYMNRKDFYFSVRANRGVGEDCNTLFCSLMAQNLGNPEKTYQESFTLGINGFYRDSLARIESPDWTDSLYEKFSLWRFLAENNIYTPKTYAEKKKQEQLDEESMRYVETLIRELE